MRIRDIPLLSGATRMGHLDDLRTNREALFRRINAEGPDVARVRFFGSNLLFVNSPDLLRELLVDKAKSFRKSPGLRGPLRPFAGEGLFTSDGELWRRQRKLMAPLFTPDQVVAYAETMASCARDAARELPRDAVIDMARTTTHVAMRIAGKTLFDVDTQAEADELGEALTIALSWANRAFGTPLYTAQLVLSGLLNRVSPRLPSRVAGAASAAAERLIEPTRLPGAVTRDFERALGTIDRLVTRMIDERRRMPRERRDLLSLLLAARDEDGEAMSDKQVRDEIVTLFVAGHETTASALAWSFYLLSRDPAAYARVAAEARRIGDRPIRAADLPLLGYTLQVFKEAMRLYPPVYFFGREATEDVRLGPYDCARGSIALISTYALHRRKDLYPEPDRFDPERFAPGAEKARHRQAYLPFSSGPRTCIGNSFALMEGPIVLATILGQVDLSMATAATVEPEWSATLRPRGGVPMHVRTMGSELAR